MGLSVYSLADFYTKKQDEAIKEINRVLEIESLNLYVNSLKSLASSVEFPAIEWMYSTADSLDVFIAQLIKDEKWIPPVDKIEDKCSISLSSYKAVLESSNSHALGFPTAFGYYIPMELNSPILHRGPIIGSSVILEKELQKFIYRLGLELPNVSVVTEDLRVKHDEILRLELFGEEKVALLQLYQMALYSVYYSSPIIFLG